MAFDGIGESSQRRCRDADLARALPAVSRPTIARALRELRAEDPTKDENAFARAVPSVVGYSPINLSTSPHLWKRAHQIASFPA